MDKLVTKLVRDKIPALFALRENNQSSFTQLTPETYKVALKHKLLEEANEVVAETDKTELAKEIGDVLDILDALMTSYEIDPAEMTRLRDLKKTEYGGFDQQWFVVGHPTLY